MRKGQNLLFCEQKRSKKNFVSLDHSGVTGWCPQEQKFFAKLFFKKACFLSNPMNLKGAGS